jgi:hypothetical protein
MASTLEEELRRPYGREHWELVRAGREGAYWQAPDGLIVRVAGAEAECADGTARALLELAVRYAAGSE